MPKSLEWPARHAEAKSRVESARTDEERFAVLPTLAKASFEVGAIDEAEAYARELLSLAVRFPGNWNYGNAIHDGHSVLGRVALARGDVAAAKQELVEAGRTPGSPQLGSFGPNVSLARDLLNSREVAAVTEYLRSCQSFWEMENGKIAHWIQLAESGEMPEFGPNLVY
jgi:hypothetical protein